MTEQKAGSQGEQNDCLLWFEGENVADEVGGVMKRNYFIKAFVAVFLGL